MKQKGKVIFIVGPTSVGKTEFAIELAERIRGVIISSDSMQGYRHMDIISQKPTPEQRARIPHHLIDIMNINEEYSAAEFSRRAAVIINKTINIKKVPIVVGGSGLYIKALIDGLFPSPKKDINFRKNLELMAKDKRGRQFLHDRLKKIDPESASKIHPHDLRRIIRALEVFHLTGMPVSEHKRKTRGLNGDYNLYIYGLIRTRETIYKRIEDRVDSMFKAGLVREVDFIRKRNPSITASFSLGYKEVLGFLNKEYSLEDARGLLIKNTRHLAKKQLTWFKADRRIRWIDLEEMAQGKALRIVIKDLKR